MELIIVLLLCASVLHSEAQINNIPSPKNLKIVEDSVTDTGFWITWEPVSKADSYRVVLSPPTIGAGGVGNGITDKFTAVEGLAPDTGYTVRIIPVKGNDEGTAAVVFQRTALPAPTSLFVVSDSVTANEMVVGWSEVKDAESYTVEVAPSTGVSGPGRGIYKNSVTLRGLTADTLYTITVKPINWVGSGGAATVKQLTKLPPPANVRVVTETVSHNSMSVHWDPVVGANTYQVSVSPPDGVLGDGQGITDSYVILRNLQADTQYRIQIAASSAAGLSDYRQAIAKTLSVCYAKGIDFTVDSFKITCPARCARNQEHVYGTREYTDDSYVCAAAVHDGRIDDNVGGEIVIKKRPGLPHYVGTGKHGVISQDYGSWHRSFVFGLQIPQNVRVQPGSVTHSTITLEWTAVSGADSYRVSVQPDLNVVGARPGIEDTKVTLSNLKSDTEYRIYLTATNTLETSEAAIIVQHTALPGPKNVHIVPNSVTHDRMNVSWYPVAASSHYVVVVRAGETEFTHETHQVSAMIDGLQSGIGYLIGVRAVNSVGLGEITGVTQYTKLSTPENVVAESVNWHRMHIEWDAVSGAKHYIVSTIPSGIRNASEETVQPWIWLEDLSPDTLYDVRVQAVNAHERSRSVVIKQMTALGAPRNLGIESKNHNSFTVMWDRMKNADSYYVTIRSIDGKYGTEDELSANKFTVTGLKGKTEYQIKVSGRNKLGDGKPAKLGVTTLIPPPSDLTIRASSINPSQIKVTWEQIFDATGYYMSVTPSAGLSGAGILRRNEALLSGLRSGILYEVTVMAFIGAERGVNTSTTFATGLPSPQNVRIDDEYTTTDMLAVEWDVVNLAEYYNITIKNLASSMLKTITPVYNSSYVFEELPAGTQFLITIYAVGKTRQDGKIKQLGSPGATAVGVTKLNMPRSIAVVNTTSTEATVAWDLVPTATQYKVFIAPEEGTSGSGVYEDPQAHFSGLVEDQTYVVWVYALNSKNNASSDRLELSMVAGGVPDDAFNYDQGGGWLGGNELDQPKDSGDVFGTTGYDNDKQSDGATKETTTDNTSWIVIVVICVCLALLILLLIIPCCCDCARNRPLLKFHGCCGCCAACSDVGCCGCRGCCPSNTTRQKMDEVDDDDNEVVRSRPHTPTTRMPGRIRSTDTRGSYNLY